MENIKESIMDAVIEEFNKKGMKFTMDDIAKDLHISKKTIYKEFNDKDELFYATVEYGFEAIKKTEAEVLATKDIDIIEKISRLIICLPDNYKNIDFRRVYQLRDKYPDVYKAISSHLERDWEDTEKLLREAMDQGVMRRLPIPVIRLMIEGTIEKFLTSEELSNSDISYDQSLEYMIDIIINGLKVTK